MASPIRKRVLTPSQMRSMLELGLLSAKGKRQAKEALAGKFDKTRKRN